MAGSSPAMTELKRRSFPRPLALFRRQCEDDGSFRRQQPEGETLLEVQFDRGCGMVEVADGDVLPDFQFEIATAGGQHQSPLEGRGPNDPSVHQTLNMAKDGIA